jgi:hypothetical protein
VRQQVLFQVERGYGLAAAMAAAARPDALAVIGSSGE